MTTPLLTLITSRSLDEDYAHVAARRSEASRTARSPLPLRWGTVAAVVVFGLLASAVVVQTAREAEAHELSRAALIKRIEAEKERVDARRTQVDELVRSNQQAATHNQAVLAQLEELRRTSARLGVSTGFAAAHGPGVRITVDSAPGADWTSQVRDEDLATLVDGLWEAGAEAIAIDGQRLNAVGGISHTNRAIHVNGRPVDAPYVITAIGDRGTLQARLLETSQGQEWFALVNGLGFRYQAQNVDDVELPQASWRTLTKVTPLRSRDGASGGEESTP